MLHRKILIIEDDLAISKIVALRLRAAGFGVISAEDGEHGYDLARVELPDLIILDYLLPGMSGLEITEALKSNKQCRHIPVIMLTARSSPEDRKRAAEAGVSFILTKPFDTQMLIRYVRGQFQSIAA